MGKDQEILPSNTLRNGAYWGMGLILLPIGIILNPWILEIILKVAIGVNVTIHPLNKLFVILFDIYIITIGVCFLLHDGLVRKFLEKIILVFSSILFALVFIEAYLHYKARPEPEIGVPSVEFHHNYAPESTGYNYPKTKGEHKIITVRTNKLAMRGNMPAINKGKDELRIIILGDSFVQADEIKYEQTMGPILEKIINNPKVFVFEHGAPSWSPLLELNWLCKTYEILRPDLVILVLCINDFFNYETKYGDVYYKTETVFDSNGYPKYFTIDPQKYSYQHSFLYKITLPKTRCLFFDAGKFIYQKIHHRPPLSQEEINLLFNASREELENLLNRLTPRTDTGEYLREMIRLGRPWETWGSATSENVETSIHYIRLMQKYLKDRNAHLIVTFAPFGWSVARDETVWGKTAYYLAQDSYLPGDGIEQKIKLFCQNEGIPYLDLPKALREFRKNHGEPLYLPMDGHWSITGHKVVAQIIYQFIMENKYIPPLMSGKRMEKNNN